jgi:hypothetical protein
MFPYGSNRVASFTGVCTVLNEGILCKALSKVVCPVETRSFADTTSIGKGLLLLLTGVLDPVTTISCNLGLQTKLHLL